MSDLPLYNDVPTIPGHPDLIVVAAGGLGLTPCAARQAEHIVRQPVPLRCIGASSLKLVAVIGHAVERSELDRLACRDPFCEHPSVLRLNKEGSPSHKERSCGGQVNNDHKTVKKIALMARLIHLVTPPGGLVLDPFSGSGSTLVAARREGCAYAGIERDPRYAAIARDRVRLDGTW